MISFTSTLAAAAAIFSITSAYDIPDNLQRIYDAHKVPRLRRTPTNHPTNRHHNQSGTCTNKLLGGFAPGVDSSDSSFAYCADISANTIYLHSQANGGQYADMDVDCDGANLGAGDCANDPTGQSQTAFQWIVADKYGIDDLDANVHPYVVFGNDDPAFDPQQHGMEPLSVMAVVCGGQLVCFIVFLFVCCCYFLTFLLLSSFLVSTPSLLFFFLNFALIESKKLTSLPPALRRLGRHQRRQHGRRDVARPGPALLPRRGPHRRQRPRRLRRPVHRLHRHRHRARRRQVEHFEPRGVRGQHPRPG